MAVRPEEIIELSEAERGEVDATETRIDEWLMRHWIPCPGGFDPYEGVTFARAAMMDELNSRYSSAGWKGIVDDVDESEEGFTYSLVFTRSNGDE